MDFITAIILGVVEGLTEFLPISSTGHLIILNRWFTFDPGFTKLFDIVIQLGAICAVLIYFREKIEPWGKNKTIAITIWKKAIIAVIPALFVGVIFGDFVEAMLFNPLTVSIALIVGGVALIFIEKIKKPIINSSSETISYKNAFLIGVIQCLALVPGTSRSAVTIIGAMLLGSSRFVAAEFSFFLAIPTLVAASAYKLLQIGFVMDTREIVLLALGLVTSFTVALGVIAFFMKYVQTRNFVPFGYYRIILGVIVLLILF